jgi:hypothetical protein
MGLPPESGMAALMPTLSDTGISPSRWPVDQSLMPRLSVIIPYIGGIDGASSDGQGLGI